MGEGCNDRLKLFGTEEILPEPRKVTLGDLSYRIAAGSVRRICWKGREVIRAIDWPMRDRNWVTLRAEAVTQDHEATGGRTGESDRHEIRFAVADGALQCRVTITGSATGRLETEIEMMAIADFMTNRAGFTVLHPIDGTAGRPLEVHHSDGSTEQTSFPLLISPGQPAGDIAGLSHVLDDIRIDIRFSGEIFEMEDQRNWSDASYKTYCVPLVHPFTYRIGQGEIRRQSIVATMAGGVRGNTGAARSLPALRFDASDEIAPDVGLVIEPGWHASSANLPTVVDCRPSHVAARLDAAPTREFLETLRQFGPAPDLEVVLPDGMEIHAALASIAERMDRSGLAPRRVIALPRAYLGSYQPNGPWPAGPTPADAWSAARKVFPDALIGGGVLTNFTEFNRCRPSGHIDFVTHGSTAIVHAADDLSVIETLEALPHIYRSARAIGGALPYRLGLVSIAGRSNPYGSGPAPNPAQIRQTLAMLDPRQRGLFAAAWATGVLASTRGSGVEALCLGAPNGPFAIMHEAQPWKQPCFDDRASPVVFPLYHVIRAAARMAAMPRLTVSGLPGGIASHAARTPDGDRMIIANLGECAARLSMGREFSSVTLDTISFQHAIRDPHWIDRAPAGHGSELELAPLATAFLTFRSNGE